MRDRWVRLLLVCRNVPSQHFIFQVQHGGISLVRPQTARVDQRAFSSLRRFSTSPDVVVEVPKAASDQWALLPEIFAEAGRSDNEIKEDLGLKNVLITHDLILRFLQSPEADHGVARRVFDWVSRNHSEKLSSKSFNWMLGILGSNGLAKDVWDLIGLMKQKGYGVSKGAYGRIFKKFQEDGLKDDIEKLMNLYSSGSVSCSSNEVRNSPGKHVSHIIKLIREEVWSEHLEKQLRDSNLEFSTDLVVKVLGSLGSDPNKALIFFRWVQEISSSDLDQRTYNLIARILSKENHSQKFWKLVSEMRSKGHELEKETYIHLLEQFVKRKMIEDAVDLYVFAMAGENKPSVTDCTFLLKKIVVSKDLDIELFRKVSQCFKENGNSLTDAHLRAVIKSLTSAGRLSTEWHPIFSAMMEAGYSGSSPYHHTIAFNLGRHDGSGTLLENGCYDPVGHGTWTSLVEGYCQLGNLAAAATCFRLALEKEAAGSSGHHERVLDLLIDTYCTKSTPLRAYKLLVEMVNDKSLKPSHATYKTLASKLLGKRHFREALSLVSMMRAHGYTPCLDSLMSYLSRKGSSEEALEFTKALTSKGFPDTSVLVQLLGQYLAAGRRSEAQDIFSKCPKYVRNHGDFLNLFCSTSTGTGGQCSLQA